MNPGDALARLRWYRTGFGHPQAEADYRRWRIERTLLLVKLSAGVSLPIWLIAPVIWYGLVGTFPRFDMVLIYGAIVPMMALGLIVERTPFLRLLPEFSAFTLMLAGSEQIYRTSWLYQGSIGLVTLCAVMFAMFAPLMRLAPRGSALAFSVLLLPAIALNFFGLGGTQVHASTILANIIMLGITLFIVITMTLVNEYSLRRGYLNELMIQRQRDAIHRYLPGEVAEYILSGREAAIASPQRRRVTILFADIAGFTDMADRVEPEVMTEVLSDHLSAMAQIIEDHGGTLNEFAGDGLMAMFGAPDAMPPDRQVASAIAAARAMQARMPELNASWRKLGLGTQLASASASTPAWPASAATARTAA